MNAVGWDSLSLKKKVKEVDVVLLYVIECTKNQLMSWSNDKKVSWYDNKEQSLEADTKKSKRLMWCY